MSRRRTTTLLEIDRDRLAAAEVVISDARVEVIRTISVTRPADVAADSHEATGRWVSGALKAGGIGTRSVVIGVPRSEVVLKRLVLPAQAATNDEDLASAVSLQMSRQLTMAIDGTAIDFAPLTSLRSTVNDEGTLSVLAAAMPGDRVAWWVAVAEAGGFAIERLGLRCCGAAALIGSLSERLAGPLVGVTIGTSATEFIVVEDGEMSFARSVEAPRPASDSEIEGFVERIAVEAKRTWMSHRGTLAHGEVESVAVFGAGDLAQRVARRCGEVMERPWQVAVLPSSVDGRGIDDRADRLAIDPLIGLAVERASSRPTIDFLHPRRAPDRAGRLRRRVLVGALGSIVLFGSAYVAGMFAMDGLKSSVRNLERHKSELATQIERARLDQARLSHVERWSDARTDFLTHLSAIHEQLPQPGSAIINSFVATSKADVAYVSKGKSFPDGEWAVTRRATFLIKGDAADRAVASELRSRLVQGGVYSVDSPGPDVQSSFSLVLSTGLSSPTQRSAEPGTTAPAAPPKPEVK